MYNQSSFDFENKQLTYILIEQLARFPPARLDQLYLSGGEADQQQSRVLGGCGRVKVVTGGIRALVQLLVDRLADVCRL